MLLISPKHEPFSAQPTPLIGVLCKVSWLLTTSVLPDTNGETDKFEVEAAPSVEAAGGDVMTTALDAVEDVQFEGRTLSQMLPWHLKVN
jgi:hypothetical protein